jgi:cobaltochelatase CobT
MASTFRRLMSWLDMSGGQRPISRYHVFTKDFDVVVRAEELDAVLGPLSPIDKVALDEAWAAFSAALLGWRTKVHLVALDAAERIKNVGGARPGARTAVTILIDQSGSMRGQAMLLAAASADVAADFLAHLGASVEVLGFTTVGWKGGKSRERWIRCGRPSGPGRLCDLLHVIYRDAGDQRASTGGPNYGKMLRPDLPKENIDGEAIEWAAARLRTRFEPKKLLIVISDGAPVDDSTLSDNGPHFLDHHLRQVVEEIQSSPDIQIAAIGIGFDVSRYYKIARTVTSPSDLGPALIGLSEELMVSSNVDAPRR